MSETAEAGHNANAQLRSIVERIENVGSQIKELQDDQKDIYLEAKGNGLDVKALRTIIRIRKQDPDDRQQQESVLETYLHALGML